MLIWNIVEEERQRQEFSRVSDELEYLEERRQLEQRNELYQQEQQNHTDIDNQGYENIEQSIRSTDLS